MEDNDFISFWENELWKMRSVLCRMSGIETQKRYCMAGKLLFLFPATLDRLRMSSQVFSNKFIAVWLLTKILTCTVCRNTWHPTWLKKIPFLSDNKKHKISSILPFRHRVQITDALESQLWGICFFSWQHQKILQKVSNISITAKYDNVINVTWQCNNYWRFYISLQLQM